MSIGVIYARYSSSNQREESIEGQLRECYSYAQKNDIRIVHEYCDRAISGKTDNRPAFQQMIADADKQQFDIVLCYTLDRFARDRYDSAVYKRKLKQLGIRVVYVTHPLSDSPESIILESVLEGYAEYYSAELARKIRRGQTENAIHCRTNGTPVLGYSKGADGTFVINPATAEIVKWVYAEFLSGKSMVDIKRQADSLGYKGARGNPFNNATVKNILTDKRYIGVYSYSGTQVENGMPKIIDDNTFRKVQKILDKQPKRRGNNMNYLLSGRCYCGLCKTAMRGESGTSRNGEIYHYYKCMSAKKYHSCDKKPEKQVILEDTVITYLQEHFLTTEIINYIADTIVEILKAEDTSELQIKTWQNDLKDIKKRINALVDAIEQGVVTKTTTERLNALEEEQSALIERIEYAEITKPKLSREHIVFYLEQFRDMDLYNDELREGFIDALVSRVDVYNDKLEITVNLSENNPVLTPPRLEVCSDKYSRMYFIVAYPNIYVKITIPKNPL